METIYKNQHVTWNTVRLNVGVKNQIIILDNNQLMNVSIGISRQNILGLNTAQSQGSRVRVWTKLLEINGDLPSGPWSTVQSRHFAVFLISIKVWHRKLPTITTNPRQRKIKFKFDEKSIEYFWEKSSRVVLVWLKLWLKF